MKRYDTIASVFCAAFFMTASAFADCSKLDLAGDWTLENSSFQNNAVSIHFQKTKAGYAETDVQTLFQASGPHDVTFKQNAAYTPSTCILTRTPSDEDQSTAIFFGKVISRFNKIVEIAPTELYLVTCSESTCSNIDLNNARKMKRQTKTD